MSNNYHVVFTVDMSFKDGYVGLVRSGRLDFVPPVGFKFLFGDTDCVCEPLTVQDVTLHIKNRTLRVNLKDIDYQAYNLSDELDRVRHLIRSGWMINRNITEAHNELCILNFERALSQFSDVFAACLDCDKRIRPW